MSAIASRVAIVTGAASGLGKATAMRLVKSGAKVALVDLPTQPGAALAASLGANAMFTPADVTKEDEIARVIEAVTAKYGQLNTVVSCAGIVKMEAIVGPSGPHTLATFQKLLTVNTVGTFNVLRLAAESMAKGAADEHGERGVIVNTASIAGIEGQAGIAAYSASKAAVIGMTLPIARELAKSGIRVNTIAPGLFLTPMLGAVDSELIKQIGSQVPFPCRAGDPDEYAALVEHIISNRYINGEVIRIDGAVRLT